MAVASTISPPDVRATVLPVLSSLPGAAISTQPATAILPILSPILRQRVQLLSTASQEPWIRLLTYDTSQVQRLTEIAQGGALDPHPVSGEIEVDVDYDVLVKYRRVDAETLQALVILECFDLFLRLVYCIGNEDGSGDGWRVGEVGVTSAASLEGSASLADAEQSFAQQNKRNQQINGMMTVDNANRVKMKSPLRVVAITADEMDDDGDDDDNDDDDDDDDYWARYDATPARTPANHQSPAPRSMQNGSTMPRPDAMTRAESAAQEEGYYARYDSVQPAMDNDDPDEAAEAQRNGVSAAPPLGLGLTPSWEHHLELPTPDEGGMTTTQWLRAEDAAQRRQRSSSQHSARSQEDEERTASLAHPRPSSRASSNGSVAIAKLEETAERREQTEFGVKQHVARSIRSLFMLSRASGIDREEFERMVKSELDVLAMVEDEI